MHEFMVLRGSMVPYIYTYARDAYDTGNVFYYLFTVFFIYLIFIIIRP